MRYLIDVPLAIAAISFWGMIHLIVYSDEPGGQQAMGEYFVIAVCVGLLWLMLAVAVPACAGIGGFPWLSVGAGGGVFVVILIILGILLVASLPIGIVLEFDAQRKWGIDQVGAARVVAFGLPLVLALYAAWVVNVPAPLREARAVHYAALSVIGALCVLAAVVSVREMARAAAVMADRQVAQAQVEDEQKRQMRREFEALTDAAPLFTWDIYVHDNVPPDIRTEALRRIALRPDLETEIADSLTSENTLWVREGLSLIPKIPFKPSGGLEHPIRAALRVVSEEIRQRPLADKRDGDKAVDYYESFALRATLDVAERMAETAGVDLRDAIDTMQQAVAVSRKSDAARTFPGQAAAAKARIATILAARRD